MTLQLFLLILLVTFGMVGLAIIVQELYLKPKRKRKAGYTPMITYKSSKGWHAPDDEADWQERLESARAAVVDAQREYRDTLQGYAKWRGDRAIEEAKQARDAELDAANRAYRIGAGDNLIPIERDNKLLAYLRQITDDSSN